MSNHNSNTVTSINANKPSDWIKHSDAIKAHLATNLPLTGAQAMRALLKLKTRQHQ